MKKIIAVFKDDLKIAGFFILETNSISVEVVDETMEGKLVEFVEFSQNNQLFLKREVFEENKRITFLDEIGKEDERYPLVFLEALKIKQFIVAEIPEITKRTLMMIDRENFEFEKRQEMVAEIINLSEENAVEMEQTIREMLLLKNEYNENKKAMNELGKPMESKQIK